METSKVVLDTNVIFSGLYSSKGVSFQILNLLHQRRVSAVLSVTLLFEYEDVLRRNAEMLYLNDEQIDIILDNLCMLCSHQKVHFLWRPYLKDPKDDHVLELAVAAEAEFIITHNIKDFKQVDKFNIEALTPKMFLEMI